MTWLSAELRTGQGLEEALKAALVRIYEIEWNADHEP
jgi:hypothetical protein